MGRFWGCKWLITGMIGRPSLAGKWDDLWFRLDRGTVPLKEGSHFSSGTIFGCNQLITGMLSRSTFYSRGTAWGTLKSG